MARKCAAAWLESLPSDLPRDSHEPVLEAANHYRKAYEFYDEYRAALSAGEPSPLTLQERARTPERIAAIAPILEQGITEEEAGFHKLKEAVSALG